VRGFLGATEIDERNLKLLRDIAEQDATGHLTPQDSVHQ